MQISTNPKENAPAVRAAEASMQVSQTTNQGNAMTNHTVAHQKSQVRAKKPTVKQRYGALIDRTVSEMGYDAAQKALFIKTIKQLDRGVSA